MIDSGTYPYEGFTMLAGRKVDLLTHCETIGYVWYYAHSGTINEPALTDSYREFWL